MDGLQLVRLQSQQVLKNGDIMTGSLTMTNAGKFIGNLQGNADTATKLTTARTLTVGNTAKSFDGTTNIAWTVAEIGAATASHTHNYAGSSSAGGAATSALTCTGNSATATKLQTARTISLTGDITGSVIFDGSANVSITTKSNVSKGTLSRLTNDVTVSTAGTSVSIGISGFSSTTDILNVYLSGVRLRPTIDYTFTNTAITGVNGITFSVGDVVSFEVMKIV